MPFEYQAMLILIACLVPVAFFILLATRHDRRVLDGGADHTGACRANPPHDDELDAAKFLTSALDTLNQEPLRSTIRAAVEARGIAQLAEETGLPRREIEYALTPGGRPSYDTVVTILHGLGYQLRLEPRQPRRRSQGA